MRSGVQWALLGLVIERPSYGYELAQRFERAYGDLLYLSGPSYIYTGIKALQARALVEEFPGRGGRRQPKPCYRATTQGVEAFRERLVEQARLERRSARMLARQLAVLARRPDVAIEVLEGLRTACIEEAETIAGRTAGCERSAARSSLANRLESEESSHSLQGRLTWIEQARGEFEAGP